MWLSRFQFWFTCHWHTFTPVRVFHRWTNDFIWITLTWKWTFEVSARSYHPPFGKIHGSLIWLRLFSEWKNESDNRRKEWVSLIPLSSLNYCASAHTYVNTMGDQSKIATGNDSYRLGVMILSTSLICMRLSCYITNCSFAQTLECDQADAIVTSRIFNSLMNISQLCQ
jgi:hypothetical protein